MSTSAPSTLQIEIDRDVAEALLYMFHQAQRRWDNDINDLRESRPPYRQHLALEQFMRELRYGRK